MNSLIFLVLALLATIAAANPVPNGGPSGLPPNDAAGSITYSGGGSAYVAIQGDYGSILKECRGLQGTSVTYLTQYTKYPDGRSAYGFQLFGDWGCKGAPIAPVTSDYYDAGKPMKGTNGKVIVPLSMRFVPM